MKPRAALRFWIERHVPGLLLTAAVAALALLAGRQCPLIGAPVFGIVFGIALRAFIPADPRHEPGIRFAGKQMLQGSIIALGFGLGLGEVLQTGGRSLAVSLATLATAALAALLCGRWLRVDGKLTVLIGVGTAICGGSAIAAVTPVLDADEDNVAFAISTIFLFNLVAVLVFPPLGHVLHMSDHGFGMWAGTAINDTSSVVAAGYAFSEAAGSEATVVKLTRATLIIPVCVALALITGGRTRRAGAAAGTPARFRLQTIIPWFILWFLAASALRTTGLLPQAWLQLMHQIATLLIVFALTAIGLSANLKRMAATGIRPIALGLCVWMAVAISSLAVQYGIGQL